ncbi:hypothetical protein ACFWPU_45595 [Streptomyces sp. NPDC058471]|uniref:hypothetical protein n=1 Tax=Streptomyces sp. NPDC058471 TaxID=3346516 RepID=UPI00366082BE
MTTRTRRRTALLCGALTLSLALTACGGSDGDSKASDTPPDAEATPSEPAASASTKDPQAKEKAAVLDVYTRMWDAQMTAYEKGTLKGTDVSKYAALNALSVFELDVGAMKKAGTVGGGTLGHRAEVAKLDLKADQPAATVTDCVDVSRWKAKRIKSGESVPLPKDQPRRYQATATVEKWDKGWMVTEYTPHGDRRC